MSGGFRFVFLHRCFGTNSRPSTLTLLFAVTEGAYLWSDSGLGKWETQNLKRKKSIFIGGKADGGVQGHKKNSPTLQANQFDVTGQGHVITFLGELAPQIRIPKSCAFRNSDRDHGFRTPTTPNGDV